ncbi:MAG: N-acetylglucosamine-6-phosphate deacetylase [Limnochordia bacterium]|jgi:N-acetylglucosamine-6-phosphate deacetylase
MAKTLALVNCHLITPLRLVKNGYVLIADGRIVDCGKGLPPSMDQSLDLQGCYLAPGFIDLHCHGGGGHDFMDGTVEAFVSGAQAHIPFGTTSLMPTTMASTTEELHQVIGAYEQASTTNGLKPHFLGLHLEGPYFSLEKRGAQDPRHIRNPIPAEYQGIMALTEGIKRWTFAPELPGALEMAGYLHSRGVLCSIGHSNATYEEVLPAFEAGCTHITHLYSAMSTVRRDKSYRTAGVMESAYLIDEMTVEIIADGPHLPSSLLQLVYKIKGSDKICLITDAMRAAGQSTKESILGSLEGGQPVIIDDGVAKLPDGSSFAGSIATANRLVANMVSLADVPLVEAVRMMTLTPARIAGIDDGKGSIAPGKDADLVAFNDELKIMLTIIGGQICFARF